MKVAATAFAAIGSGGEDNAASPDQAPARSFAPRFIDEVIQALIELDAEHLETLAAAAEQFRADAVRRLSAQELAETEGKMRLLSALLVETRRNLRVFAAAMGASDPLGYKPGRG